MHKLREYLLKLLGGIDLGHARHINNEIVSLYCRGIQHQVQDDFGLPPRKTGLQETVEWANEMFDLSLKQKTLTPRIIYVWEIDNGDNGETVRLVSGGNE